MNDAAHVHQHRFEGSRRRLQLAFWTQLAFFVVELGAAFSPTAWPFWPTPGTC